MTTPRMTWTCWAIKSQRHLHSKATCLFRSADEVLANRCIGLEGTAPVGCLPRRLTLAGHCLLFSISVRRNTADPQR